MLRPLSLLQKRHDHQGFFAGLDIKMKSRRAQLVVSCLIIILVRSQAQAALTTTKSVASGPELVAAIEDTGVGTIFVKKPIVLEASDFPSTVITLDRNLTIASDPAGPHQVGGGGCTQCSCVQYCTEFCAYLGLCWLHRRTTSQHHTRPTRGV